MHANSRLLFERYAEPLLVPEMKVLELGPDGFPSTYQRLAKSLPLIWHTLDIFGDPRLTYPNSDEYAFPIPSDTYDVVLSGQVIEHVRKPWRWIPELARVTKVGGYVITIGPVSWTYHEAPIDCWRIYPEGMKALYEEARLAVVTSVWESLETPDYRRYLPGMSKEQQSRRRRIMYSILGRLGLPVERSYDAITIGKKELCAV